MKNMAEELQNRVLWHEAEVRNAESRLESRKSMAVSELEDVARRVKEGRLYSTDAQNLNRF
jgi:hypothetical protein